MSMSSSVVYGYGFEIDVNEKVIANFIKNHAETIRERNCPTELDLLDDCLDGNVDNIMEEYSDIECDTTGRESVYAIVSNIMSEETGIQFRYEQGNVDINSLGVILFCPEYPWYMNEIEKKLTEEKLEEIVNNYVDELSITATKRYLEVEYWG